MLLAVMMVTIAIAGSTGMLVASNILPTWYPRALRGWGRYPWVRVDFVLGPWLRLREGDQVQQALGRMFVRQELAALVPLGCVSASMLVLLVGPRLSTSVLTSVTVAGLVVAAPAVTALMLRDFLSPYRSTSATTSRPARMEDYLVPPVRALVWVVAGSALVIPVTAVLLAAGPSYDASKVFWEGLVAVPLACVAIVVLTERWLRGCDDASTEGDPTLYVWDCLRAQAVRVILGVTMFGVAYAWGSALGSLAGAALLDRHPAPSWLSHCLGAAWLMGLISTLTAVAVVFGVDSRWMRRRLWPALGRKERVEFGVTMVGEPSAGR